MTPIATTKIDVCCRFDWTWEGQSKSKTGCNTYTIEALPPRLQFSNIDYPESVNVGQSFTISCNITLLEPELAKCEICLYTKSNDVAQKVSSKEVSLSKNETEKISFAVKADTIGTLDLAIAPSGYDGKPWTEVCKNEFIVMR